MLFLLWLCRGDMALTHFFSIRNWAPRAATHERATSGNRLSSASATTPSSCSTPWRPTGATIPNSARCFTFNKRLYKLRWRIEAAFNRSKDFRRIATRYDGLARNYLASVCLAAALVWWV